VYILVINEGVWFGEKLTNSLINPKQLRYAGITVQNNPFHPTELMAITHEDVVLHLHSQGTTIFFETTTPTQQELNHSPHIILTFDTEWNPHTAQLAAVQSVEAEDIFGATEPGLAQISSVYCFNEMVESLQNQRQISLVDVEARKTFISKERHPAVMIEDLNKRWNIGLNQAKQTLKVTTQRGIRSAILPVSRRYQ
jgi:hypothetical protein